MLPPLKRIDKMKATHKLQLDLTVEELAEMLANASARDFTKFWMVWEIHMANDKLDDIAKGWGDYNNGKRVFKKFLTMIDYHELKN